MLKDTHPEIYLGIVIPLVSTTPLCALYATDNIHILLMVQNIGLQEEGFPSFILFLPEFLKITNRRELPDLLLYAAQTD